MEFKEWLKTRIDKAGWDAYWQEHDKDDYTFYRPKQQYSYSDLSGLSLDDWHEWWCVRESMRMVHGVYNQSSVLLRINDLYPGFYLHVSLKEPQAVAFTPDRAAGAADRQVPISLGRWLARYAPHLGDKVIKALVSEHSAEVDATVEFIEGGGFKEIYNNPLTSSAFRACMSKEFSTSWHSTDVYNMPNIKLAVIRDSNGVPKDRCFVREDTKQYIRHYPADSVRMRVALERLGYTVGSWAGIELNKVVLEETDTHVKVVMPYLDARNSRASEEHCSVYMLDGKLKVATPEQRNNWAGVIHMYYAAGTSGTCTLKKHTTADFNFVDEITGKVYSRLTDDFSTFIVYTVEGLKETADAELFKTLVKVWVVCEDSVDTKKVLADSSLPTFRFRGLDFLDTEHNRACLGYAKLSARYYPEEQEWVYATGNNLLWSDYGYIKTSDAVRLLDGSGVGSVLHKSEVVGNESFVKLHALNRNSVDVYTHKDFVVLTRSKRKVHPMYHDVGQTWDGQWDFKKNLEYCWVSAHLSIWKRKDEESSEELVYNTVKRRFTSIEVGTAYANALHSVPAVSLLKQLMCYSDLPSYITYKNTLWAFARGNHSLVYKEFAARGIDVNMAVFAAVDEWAASNNSLVRGVIRYAREVYTLWRAEAEAVDYNTVQASTPESGSPILQEENALDLELV